VVSREVKTYAKARPSAPFYLPLRCQQAAVHVLGFGVKKTMMMAQRLYEAGHITYMRRIHQLKCVKPLKTCRHYISDNCWG